MSGGDRPHVPGRPGAGGRAARLRRGARDDWVYRLSHVVANLSAAARMPSLVDTIITGTTYAVGAKGAVLRVIDEDGLNLVALGTNMDVPADESGTAPQPLSDRSPTTDALRLRRPVSLAGRAEVERAYPGMPVIGGGELTLTAVPLLAGEREVGTIGLQFQGIVRHNALQLEILSLFAASCAQALERVRATDTARRNAQRLSFLQRVSDELASSLDYEITVGRVAALAVPELGDWCTVFIVEDGQLRTLAVAQAEPAKSDYADRLRDSNPRIPLDADHGIARVARTGVSELIAQIDDKVLADVSLDDAQLGALRQMRLDSAVVVPLKARGTVLGVMSLASARGNYSYGPADVIFAEELADRAAVAIDNAEMHSQVRDFAQRLQDAVRPKRFFDIDGWDIAAYYRPSGRTEVGGDFYEAIPLPDGRLVVLIADVMGRGVDAAATMAQTLSALRILVALDPDPDVVLARLHETFDLYGSATRLVTIAMLLIDPVKEEMTIGNAGHLPPILVSDGDAIPMWSSRRSPPIGAHVAPAAAVTMPFPRGATVLLYTDGVVERRREHLDVGLNRLADAAAVTPDANLAEWLSEVLETVLDPVRADDAAGIALRRAR